MTAFLSLTIVLACDLLGYTDWSALALAALPREGQTREGQIREVPTAALAHCPVETLGHQQ